MALVREPSPRGYHATVSGRLEVVFLDIGGVMYDDAVYRQALLDALRELGASMSDDAFTAAYEDRRRAQRGSFKRILAERFLGPGADLAAVEAAASRRWNYPATALEPDVLPCLELLAARYRLGLIANQPSTVREALARDGLAPFFSVWAVSEDLRMEKPNPRLFAHAIDAAEVPANACAMVGDRLDYDIRPARSVGMRTVWVLRGEAPDEPTSQQLAEADAAIRTLDELPGVLFGLEESEPRTGG